MLISSQTMTCQLVLATDYISTYGYFLYNDTTWNSSVSHPVTIGYDARDFVNYNRINLPGQSIYRVEGNTGHVGEWYFNFSLSEGGSENPDKGCYKLSYHEDINGYRNIPSHLECPCTRQQALFDWRFWFGYFWGISSRPNCATFIFSQLQGTTECCYDSNGLLIVEQRYGGSYFLYNPLFYYQEHLLRDRLLHEHCCVNSRLCQLYYTHRPSSDCRRYTLRPPRPGK